LISIAFKSLRFSRQAVLIIRSPDLDSVIGVEERNMTRNIGERVTLAGKTYEIIGHSKKSYLLKLAGVENSKTYKCGPAKLERMVCGIPRAVHQRTASGVPAYLERMVKMEQLFGKPEAKLPESEAEIMKYFSRLTSDLSPENLHCDGEISASAARAKHREIMQAWRYLEAKLGRKMTEEEVYKHEMNRR
jgi:hypothetical protein